MLRRADAAATTAIATRSAVAACRRRSLAAPASFATRRSVSGNRRLEWHPSRRSSSSNLMLHPRASRGALALVSDPAFGFGYLGSVGGGRGCGRRKSSSASRVIFTAPPEDLEEGCFERPTPLLLVAGEGQPAAWWSVAASFFAARGCTVGTMVLTGRGSSPTETLSLGALQSGVAAAVEKSGLTPPVIVAHSMAGFVCQQYLQSYSASGLVLLDSFPPAPGALSMEHLLLASACARDPRHRHHYNHHDDLGEAPPCLTGHELAHLVKEDPASWEGLLRAHFEEFHRHSPFAAKFKRDVASPDEHGDRIQNKPFPDVEVVAVRGENASMEESSRSNLIATAVACLRAPPPPSGVCAFRQRRSLRCV